MAQREIASGFIYPQTATATNGTTRYGKNINKPFKVLKGVDVDILFFLKKENGIPIKLSNKQVSAIITKSIGNEVILSKPLVIEDENTGSVKMRLSSIDTSRLQAGFYHLNLIVKSPDGVSPSYMDTTFSVNYYIEILDNFINSIPTVVEIDRFLKNGEIFYSMKLSGSAQYISSCGVSTFSVKFNDFSGTFGVQATLQASPNESDWFAIDLSPTTINNTINYTNYTGIEHFTFEGKFVWVRFFFEKTNGTIDKISYLV